MGNWQFGLTYDYNTLRDVIAGTEKLNDDLRQRTTHTFLFEVSYGLTSNISLNIIDQRELALGVGPKLPFGNSDIRDGDILLPADMQPGTGAWDGILWGYFYQGFLPKMPANIFSTLSYRFTGKSKRTYEFGDEFSATFGGSYRTKYGIDFSLLTRYRSVTADKFGDS